MSKKGFLKGYNVYVWYGEGGIANILGIDDLCNCFEVSFDNKQHMFMVKMPNGTIIFRSSTDGMFYYDTDVEGALSLAHIFGMDEESAKLSHDPATNDTPNLC